MLVISLNIQEGSSPEYDVERSEGINGEDEEMLGQDEEMAESVNSYSHLILYLIHIRSCLKTH